MQSLSSSNLSKILLVTMLAMFWTVQQGSARDGVNYNTFPSFIYFDVDKQIRSSHQVVKKNAKSKMPVRDVRVKNDGSIHIVNQPLADFLKLASRQLGFELEMSRRFKVNITNTTLPGDLNGMMDQLANQFDFIWYRQGDVVRVNARDEALSRMIFLGDMKYQDLQSNLKQAGLHEKDIKLTHIPRSNSVLVNGPASLIARVELIADGHNKNASGVSLISYGKKR